MRDRLFSPVLAIVFVCSSLSACQNFFTTSLAAPLARDPADLVPKVTAKNAATIASQVKSDPDASLVVLTSLPALISASGGAAQAELVSLALNVSTSASGLGGALLQSTGAIADLLMDGDFSADDSKTELFGIIDGALSGLKNLGPAAQVLEDIFSQPAITVNDIAATASADEMAMAAVVLLSAEAGNGGVAAYVEELGEKDPADLSDRERLAMDLAEAAAAKYADGGGTGPLADVLAALNLTGA